MSTWQIDRTRGRSAVPAETARTAVPQAVAAPRPHTDARGIVLLVAGAVGFLVSLLVTLSPVGMTAGLVVSSVVAAIGWELVTDSPGEGRSSRSA